MVKWKLPAGAGVAGAAISLAAGFAAGNAFGTVLLRALVSALLAAGLGFAVQQLLRRFLPDLHAGQPGEAPGAVDIVIDDEVPAPGQRDEVFGEEPGPETGEGFGAGVPSQPEPAAEALPEPAESLAEAEALPEPGREGLAPLGTDLPFSVEPGPGPEELPPAPEEAGAGAPGDLEDPGLSAAEPDGGLESLSGLDSVGPSTRSSRSLKAEELGERLSSLTKGQDPASLAKAVRTFMRKDREG